MLDIEAIKEILPHRPPFLMLDRVLELEPNKKVVAIKNISINDNFFKGHFPTRPIMPGVLIIEAMAQASIILFYHSKRLESKKELLYYLGTVKMRFLKPVIPGDQLRITVEPLKILSNVGIVKAEAQVEDKEIARGELAFSVKEA